MMAEPCFMNTYNMDASLNTNLDGNDMTTLAESGNLIEGHDMESMDRQIMTTEASMEQNVGHTEVVAMREVMVPDEQLTIMTAAEEAAIVAEVDPLALSVSGFLSADEAVLSPSSGTPRKSVSCTPMTPCRVFLSPAESTPSISGRVRDMFASLGVDVDKGIVTRGRRVAGRRQAVVEDDMESLSSMSATSTGGDSSMAFSSRVKRKGRKEGRKGVKRDREEAPKGKDCRKEGKTEGSSEENKRERKGKKKEMRRKETLEEMESDGICDEPKGVVEHILEDMSSSVLGDAIQEWANTIEDIRVKSKNMQGRLSGVIKKCVAKIKEGTALLVARSEATGDPHFLRTRNTELVAQLRKAEKENARL